MLRNTLSFYNNLNSVIFKIISKHNKIYYLLKMSKKTIVTFSFFSYNQTCNKKLE